MLEEILEVNWKYCLVYDRHAIRLNRPWSRGIWRIIDRFIFKYGNIPNGKDSYGLPCFLPMYKLRKQLVVDGKRVYRGGGITGFSEPIPIVPVCVNSKELAHCRQAAQRGSFRIRKYDYNGFGLQMHEGYANFEAIACTETRDPGCWSCDCSDGVIRHIPGCAIEGVEILMRPVNIQLRIFGPSSKA